MARTEKYFIGPKLLGEIRHTITRVAGVPDRSASASQPFVYQDLTRAPVTRYVSWTSEWPADETQAVRFLGATAQTANAVNSFTGVGPGHGWVVQHRGTWHLAAVNLAMQANYVDSEIQLLGHSDEGILRWYSVTQCSS